MSTITPLPNNKIIGYSELKRAREIQDEAIKLHLPAPPVVWLEVKVTNNDNIRKHIQSKSNSYVRNAYNVLTSNLTFPNPIPAIFNGQKFEDGVLSLKEKGGTTYSNTIGFRCINDVARILIIGEDNTPDTIDDYKLYSEYANMQTDTITSFNFNNRRFITNIIGSFVAINNIDIGEVGLFARIQAGSTAPGTGYSLVIRDVFNPKINLNVGEILTLNYQLEVAYP